MSVVVCRSPAVPVLGDKEGIGASLVLNSMAWGFNSIPATADINPNKSRVEHSDVCSMIQSQKPTTPYVHPLMRRSSSMMSQKSLEMCTESLGSETGSDDFYPFSDDDERERVFSPSSSEAEVEEEEVVEEEEALETGNGTPKELWSVNYHCSVGRRSSSHPPRSFPPPLSSISRRDGPCLHMRPHRRDGRLVMEAVPVPSHNYLHARRYNGRLILAFVDSSSASSPYQPPRPVEPVVEPPAEVVEEEEADDDVEYEDEEEEEEVEVVDRGAVVEVKVSTQPQQHSGAMRVHRSSLVINKFVGGPPLTNQNRWAQPPQRREDSRTLSPPQRRSAATTTTAAAAAVAASSASSEAAAVGERPPSPEKKLLFTSKRRNRAEMLHRMRRCSELRRPLFFWEPCCIATS